MAAGATPGPGVTSTGEDPVKTQPSAVMAPTYTLLRGWHHIGSQRLLTSLPQKVAREVSTSWSFPFVDFLLWSCVSWLLGWVGPVAPGKAGSSVWHLLPCLSRQALLPWVAPPNGGLGSQGGRSGA